MMNKFAIILSTIATSLAILALCSSFPALQNLNIDYLGLIVGILAFLVTTLLGWQIFNFFSFEKRLRDLENSNRQIGQMASELKSNITKEHYFCEAIVSVLQNNDEYRQLLSNEKKKIGLFMNLYIRYCECLQKFILADDPKYPAYCLIQMDYILSQIIDLKDSEQCPKDKFDKSCDDLYEEIMSSERHLSVGNIDFLHAVRARRKSVFTNSPLPAQTNPWGIRMKSNRVPEGND